MIGINLDIEEDKIEERRDRIIDMVLDLLIEIENGEVKLLDLEKQWLPDTTIGLEKVILTYRRYRVPEGEWRFRVMQRNGLL